MKSCLILCVLVGVGHCFNFPNPFARKNATQQLPKEIIQRCFENYTELGCFGNDAPWRSFLRPFPMPQSPKTIDAKIYLYTSKYPDEPFTVKLWKDISIKDSDFDPQRSHTAFIIHGFASNGNESWLHELKNVYLKQRDANVFIVDWGKGASHWNYFQVAANTRIVGAELKRFVKYLIEAWHLDPARIHFMGHSLGAHISSYATKGNPGVGQLTAFDPAQPGFEGCPAEVRLHETDASFVDVIHTNIRPAFPLLGFGLILPAGHVDYYMNGGALQPGCIAPPAPIPEIHFAYIENLNDIVEYPDQIISTASTYAKLISEWVACSHGKSYQYYIEALHKDNCTFWGRSTSYFGTLIDIATLGKGAAAWQEFTKLEECALDTCSPIGLDAEEYPARGSFSVGTSERSPYCHDEPKITSQMRELKLQKLQRGSNEQINNYGKGPLDVLKDIFKPYF